MPATLIATPAQPTRPRAARVGRLPLEALLDARAAGLPSALDLHPTLLSRERRQRPAPPATAAVFRFEDEASERREERRRTLVAAGAWLASAAVTGLSIAAALG